MKRQHNLMEASQENPNRVQFYEKKGKLRVKIAVDRTSTLDRVATDDDKQAHAKHYQRYLSSTPVSTAPKKRGRPRKAD